MSKSKPYRDMVEFMAAMEKKGTKVELDDGDAEQVDVVVCRLVTDPLIEPDNLVGNCMKCFRMVQFRPYAPKKPPRLCDECAVPEMSKRAAENDLKMVVTERTLDDIAKFLVKKGMH